MRKIVVLSSFSVILAACGMPEQSQAAPTPMTTAEVQTVASGPESPPLPPIPLPNPIAVEPGGREPGSDKHQAPEYMVERCQSKRIAAETGRSEHEAQLSYCDGAWAKYGAPATEQVLYAQFVDDHWVELKPDGRQFLGLQGPCWLPETIAELSPPEPINLTECVPGGYDPSAK